MISQRCSGILLPVASLPSPYGIGTLGRAAYDFVKFLARSGQTYWQILPVGPISYGDSPYQSFSTFAGNPYFVDLDLLIEDGLLRKEEVEFIDWGTDPEKIDYGKVYEHRFTVLRKAANRGIPRDAAELELFREANRSWLPDYALFMALKNRFDMHSWTEWEEEDIRLHRPEACEAWRSRLAEDVAFYEYIQFLFFRQWNSLRAFAHEQGIQIIGDIPIYVALDSADVWAGSKWFQLDETNTPTKVAGVPPDYFNEDGQLWGNPLYRWDRMKQDGYQWWIDRIAGALKLYDMIRFDHFRGLSSYWAVPFGEETARNGEWVEGPGLDFVQVLHEQFPASPFIAEDLGYLNDNVKLLLQEAGFPGMRILEFGFEAGGAEYYQPPAYPEDSICYIGTHDNEPIIGWRDTMAPEDVALAVKFLGLTEKEGFHWGFIRSGMASRSNLFIAQMQDYLALGTESRINRPGIPTGNWTWRLTAEALTAKLGEHILALTKKYGRRNPACGEE